MKREIRERCTRLEAQVRSRQLATEAELAEYRPAAARAPALQWVWYYAQLVRFCGRMELRELDTSEADALVLAALRAEPVSVERADGSRLEVHPKSLEALLYVHTRDRLLEWLAARYAALRERDRAEDLALLQAVARELAYQNLLVVWVATTAGPGLPFPDETDRPDLPESYHGLEPWDVMRVHRAFLDVNASRLQALDRLITPPKGEAPNQRPSWSVFVGQLAMKLKVDPRRLMRDQALVALLAMVKLAAPADGADPEEAVA